MAERMDILTDRRIEREIHGWMNEWIDRREVRLAER
jgi:hypothetical protein